MFIRILAIVMACTLLGCARENEPSSEPIRAAEKVGNGCTSQMSDQLARFWAGNSSPSEVRAFWNCSENLVDKFLQFATDESNSGRYSKGIVRNFLHTYFLKKQPVSIELVEELLHLKRILIAGNPEEISRQEIEHARDLIAVLREISLLIEPHARILFAHSSHVQDRELRAAEQALDQAALELGKWITAHRQSYSFAQLKRLLQTAAPWFEAKPRETIDNLLKMVEILPPLKGILVGGSPLQIEAGEWIPLAKVLSVGFRVYLDFAENLSSGFGRATLPENLLAMSDVLERSITLREAQEIPLSEWEALFHALSTTQWLSAEIEGQDMLALWTWVLQRPLGHDNVMPTGLSLAAVQRLRAYALEWKTLLQTQSSPRFDRILADSPGMEWDVEGRLIFRPTPRAPWTLASRRQMVWQYVVLDLLKNGYVDPSVDFFTQETMNVAVGEVLPLLQGFGWLLTTTPDAVSNRRFREADVFTIGANGDGILSLSEAMRYLSLIMSAYRYSALWLESAEELCGSRAARCVRSIALVKRAGLLDSMPTFARALEHWPETKFAQYMRNAERAIFGGETLEQEYGTAALLQVVQLFEYVETFLQRYDRDSSDSIVLSEALVSYENYGPTLSRLLSPSTESPLPDEEVRAFFTFMMKYGDTPFTMYGGDIAYINWKLRHNQWSFTSERDVLMGILSQLSSF